MIVFCKMVITKKFTNGFTLAEVLITLGIIGVVAALTIPAMISKHEKTVAVNQLKATYSILNQALTRAKVDFGEFKDWDYVVKLNWLQRDPGDFIMTYLDPYVTKLVLWDTETGPHGTSISMCGQKYHVLVRGERVAIYGGGNAKWASFSLPNGACVTVIRNQDNSESTYASSIGLWVDINGTKGPNLFSVDFHKFYIDRDKGILRPWMYDSSISDITAGSFGCGWEGQKEYCTYKIIQDGWQIKDDYPWKK